jgi:hypothetical protein
MSLERNDYTEIHGRLVSIPASYSRCPGLKSRPGDRLYKIVFLWLSLVPPGKFQCSTLNQTTTASFRIISNLLFINHPLFRRYIVWATDSVLK